MRYGYIFIKNQNAIAYRGLKTTSKTERLSSCCCQKFQIVPEFKRILLLSIFRYLNFNKREDFSV